MTDRYAFAAALRTRDPGRDPRLPDVKSQSRFSIYRNNVFNALTDALLAVYPAVHRLVGEQFFRAAAAAFIEQEQARSPILARYGSGFAEFIEVLPGTQHVPYLGDVARIEYAYQCAANAADLAVCTLSELTKRQADAAVLRCVAHPAATVLSSAYPAVSIWHSQISSERNSVDITATAEWALIVRPLGIVKVVPLDPTSGRAAKVLLSGAAVAEACHDDPSQVEALVTLVRCGAVSSL